MNEAPFELSADMQDLHDNWPLSEVITLPEAATIVVVGAYKGRLIEYILTRYDPDIIIGYEPQLWAAHEARERTGYNSRVHLYDYGLGTRDLVLPSAHYGTDACTCMITEQDVDLGPLLTLREATSELKSIAKIDLLVMNIEGYEFELLPHIQPLFASLEGLGINRLAVQFHTQYTTPAIYARTLDLLDKSFPNRFTYFLPSWGYWWAQA